MGVSTQTELRRTEAELLKQRADNQKMKSARDVLQSKVHEVQERVAMTNRAITYERQQSGAAELSLNKLYKELKGVQSLLNEEPRKETVLKNTINELNSKLVDAANNHTRNFQQLEEFEKEAKQYLHEAYALKHLMVEFNDKRKKAVKVRTDDEAALTKLKIEGKQLRGAVPWLQAKVASNKKQVEELKKELEKAKNEKITATAKLHHMQDKMKHLKDQYSSTLTGALDAEEVSDAAVAESIKPGADHPGGVSVTDPSPVGGSEIAEADEVIAAAEADGAPSIK